MKPTKVTVKPPAFDEALYKEITSKYGERLRDALDTAEASEDRKLWPGGRGQGRDPRGESRRRRSEKRKLAYRAFERLRERIFRDDMLVRRRRPDARAFDQIRQITCEVGVLPRVHGSALFTRGETQALATTTLGTKEDKQRLDLLFEEESFKRFMLHYNFPPFSVGEVKFLRGPGRREIGHGALAERALANLLPPEADFPYAMRVVSDILESNGSSSMATVCGGSLALMDAGVPLKAPCAGIAMGLVVEGEKYAILTDIAGAEDHYGDMDFKVAGTRQGITALQMDIKVGGVSVAMMREALAQARKARLEILDIMDQTISSGTSRKFPRMRPRLHMLQIPTDKIRDLIGPGGKKIRSIIEATGVKIDVMDDGKVHVFANNGTGGGSGAEDDPRRHRYRRNRQDVSRHGGAHRGIRRVRRNFPRHGRPAAHQRNRRAAHPRRSRRAEGRRSGAGEGAGHRGQQDSPEPQGRAARSARQTAQGRSSGITLRFSVGRASAGFDE